MTEATRAIAIAETQAVLQDFGGGHITGIVEPASSSALALTEDCARSRQEQSRQGTSRRAHG